MKKILLATPLKGDIPAEYVRSLCTVLNANQDEFHFLYAFLGGCTVQWARDELVHWAIKEGCEAIIPWDKDLEVSPEQIMHLAKHTEPVVCALYSKRSLFTHWHVTGIPGEVERPDGLIRVEKGAIGFSKINIEVFHQLRAKFPERQYWKQDGGEKPVSLFEYFPMGIVGPNSHIGKLERIQKIVVDLLPADKDADLEASPTIVAFGEIIKVLMDADYSTNQIRGEDYYFCELLKQAGIPLYVDTKLIVPHRGDTLFPIQNKDLLKMLEEPWRQDELRALRGGEQALAGQQEETIIPS